MKTRALWALLVGGSILVTGGCATKEEWGEWRTHTSHFASDRHLGFSVRNDNQGANPRVTRPGLGPDRELVGESHHRAVDPDLPELICR